ncbi:GerMN domain-containing protein [Defluviitalea phaphyphila]|uniref:GerMN domain-containing protein n=1 Tax=Defluviitalea phaphyphila TaxID=1473580 RepID=UPI000731B6F0|nr:GerMN domain-containing protein [Defluviitalea phaphyphila]
MKFKQKPMLLFLIIFSISLLVLLISFKIINNSSNEGEVTQVKLYFINGDNSELKEEIRTVDFSDKKDLIKYAVEELKNMPKTSGLKPSIPQSIKIKTIVLEGTTTKVDISLDYNNLSPQEQVLFRASLIKTLTEFDFIDSVEMMIDGEAMVGVDGKPIGAMTEKDIVLGPSDEVSKLNLQNIKLYFADKNGEKLILEEREIEVNPNIALEKYIVEQLIVGPMNEELLPTIPSETTIKDIETKDGICYVDLSDEFRTKHSGGSTGETLTIYSIVNSLTELPNVKKVQFLIEGEKQQEFKGHYDFSGPFERDENLIKSED